MNIEQEIRAQIEKNKGLKLAVGEINNHLSILEGLLRNERDDVQKQVDEAYQRGLNDAWAAARKIVCDEELDWNTLLHLFNRSNFEGIFGDFSPSEAIAKLKSYEEKQKADGEIKVGDEVITPDGTHFVVFEVGGYFGDDAVGTFILFGENNSSVDIKAGCFSHSMTLIAKTGRHFDIDKILAEMRT